MAKKQQQRDQIINIKDFEKLLNQQTAVILNAVNAKLERFEEEIKVDVRLEIDKLAKTLDKFLKQMTDFNDEFKIVKARLSKIEKIIQEKLGVTID